MGQRAEQVGGFVAGELERGDSRDGDICLFEGSGFVHQFVVQMDQRLFRPLARGDVAETEDATDH